MPTSVMPASRIASRAWNRIGVPAIGISCFAFVWVMRPQAGALPARQDQRAHQGTIQGRYALVVVAGPLPGCSGV